MQTDQLAPIDVVRLFETTVADREWFVVQIIEKIESGEVEPLKIHAQVKSMEDIINRLTDASDKGKSIEVAKQFKDSVLAAAQAYGQKKFDAFNGKFEIKEVGTKYDYSQCNDPELSDLEAKAKDAADKLKERQKFLQTVNPKGLDIITSDGEVVTVYPPSKTSTTSVTVSLR